MQKITQILILLVAAVSLSAQDSIPFIDSIAVDSLKVDSVAEDTLIVVDSLVADTLVVDSLTLVNADTITTRIEEDTLSIVMVGDVMLGTDFPSTSYLPAGNNCWPLLEPVSQYIQEGDISFCNLEGVFAGENGTPKNCKNPKTCYVFRMPDSYLDCITNAGFNLLSVANNHVNDFGLQGRIHEAKLLDEAGINYAGFISRPYTIYELKGLKIGFCAFSPNTGVMDLRNTTKALEIISILGDSCDITIVSFHGGAEGRDHQHVTRETEIYLGANRGNVYDFAHRAIDAGADVLIGHGPHVTRAVEVYNDRFIAYSLGNFATYARFNISGPSGIAPLINIQVNSKGEFLGGKVIPTRQLGEGGAKPDPNRAAIFKLQQLMQTDFPESDLRLSNDGVFEWNDEK